jgi:hypothetical protein
VNLIGRFGQALRRVANVAGPRNLAQRPQRAKLKRSDVADLECRFKADDLIGSGKQRELTIPHTALPRS